MTPRGPATQEMLEELHRLLVEDLAQALGPNAKRKPPPAMLAVTRALLQQEGITAPDAEAVRRVQRLYRMYLLALLKEMQSETRPNAAVIAEVGRFLRTHGVVDLTAERKQVQALQQLAEMRLPFAS